MKRIDSALKGIISFLLVLLVVFYIFINLPSELNSVIENPPPSSKKHENFSSTEVTTGQENNLKNEYTENSAGTDKRSSTEKSVESFSKSDIVRKAVTIERVKDKDDLVRMVKRYLPSVYKEIREKKSSFLPGYIIIKTGDGKELARGVIRPDNTYIIVVAGKPVEEGFLDEVAGKI